MNRLTDAYIDRILDKTSYEERRGGLLNEQKMVEERLADAHRNGSGPGRLEKFLELAGNALLSYQMGIPEEKRQLLKILTSNRKVAAKNVVLEPSIGFREVINRSENATCGPQRDTPRTWDVLLDKLSALNMQGLLPDFTPATDSDDDTGREISLKG
jgi:hypothetical protein